MSMSAFTGLTASTVKFVASDADGLPLKRKQVQHACLACRKRKKRCTHNGNGRDEADQELLPSRPQKQQRLTPQKANGYRQSLSPDLNGSSHELDEDASQEAASQLVELSSRFVCDMNPEGMFIQATAPASKEKEASYRTKSDIGMWFPPSANPQAEAPAGTNGTSPVSDPEHKPHVHKSDPDGVIKSERALAYERARNDYLWDECLKLMPPEEDFKVLKDFFLEEIHPIFPVFTEEDLNWDGPPRVYITVMRQVIAMAASHNDKVSKHLRLARDGPVLAPRAFHRRLSNAVLAVIDADLISYRVDLIRVLVMVAFYFQPNNAKERSRASFLCTQAAHHLHNLGAHLLGYRCPKKGENIEALFLAVWAVDRVGSAWYSRPTIMHERDNDRDIDEHIKLQPPASRLFLRIVQSLDKVIGLYQPKHPFELIDIPVFEALIVQEGAMNVPSKTLATIEVFYHAICVLSCRQPFSAFSDSSAADDMSHLPHPIINPRRSLSADRIVWIVQNEDISPLPLIPYAVSLALTVQYRKMRFSKTPMYRNRARAAFKEIVAVLKRYSVTNSGARLNAQLGESILREMNKTACTLARDEPDHGAQSAVNGRSESAVAQRSGEDGSGNNGHDQKSTEPGGESVAVGQLGVLPLDASMEPFDPSILDNLNVDVDLFGYFDPNFNLGAVDTALEANLDMGIPQNWTSTWNHFGS